MDRLILSVLSGDRYVARRKIASLDNVIELKGNRYIRKYPLWYNQFDHAAAPLPADKTPACIRFDDILFDGCMCHKGESTANFNY